MEIFFDSLLTRFIIISLIIILGCLSAGKLPHRIETDLLAPCDCAPGRSCWPCCGAPVWTGPSWCPAPAPPTSPWHCRPAPCALSAAPRFPCTTIKFVSLFKLFLRWQIVWFFAFQHWRSLFYKKLHQQPFRKQYFSPSTVKTLTKLNFVIML